jgi:pSer/pThr/pTyr-binding forkhead associated (FHA) protein
MNAEEARAKTSGHHIDTEAPTSSHVIDPGQATALHAADHLQDGHCQSEKTSIGDAYNLALNTDGTQEGRRHDVTAFQDLPDLGERNLGKVKIIKGEGAGETIELHTSPAFVGRDDECAITLADATVSRQHLEFYFEEDDGQWVAEDMGSGSGSLIGGKPIELPTPIRHGDVITVGRTELRFFYAEGRPEQAPESEVQAIPEKTSAGRTAVTKARTLVGKPKKALPSFRRKKTEAKSTEIKEKRSALPWIVAGVALLAIGALVTGSWMGVQWVQKRTATDPKILQNQVRSLIDDAHRLIADRQLQDAEARAQTILALEKDNVEVQSILRTIRTEGEAEVALANARALLKKGDLEGAQNMLGRIPKSSIFSDDAHGLKSRIDERVRKNRLQALEKQVEAKEYDAAEAALAAFLVDYPNDVAALALQEKMAAMRNAKAPTHPSVIEARKLFATGQVDRARAVIEMHANKGVPQAKRYLTDLERFDTARNAGRAALKAQKGGSASGAFQEAYSLIPPLGGGNGGAVQRRLGLDYGNALYLKGMKQKGSGDKCGAAKSLWRAKQVSPKDAKIKAQTRAFAIEARAAIDTARAKSASDPGAAKAMAQKARCLVQASSPEGRQLRLLATGR